MDDKGKHKKRTNLRVKKSYLVALLVYLVIFIVTLLNLISIINYERSIPPMVEYSEFKDDLESESIDTIYIDRQAMLIRYTMLNDDTEELSTADREKYNGNKEWKMTYYANYPEFAKDTLEYGCAVKLREFYPLIPRLLVYSLKLIPILLMCAMIYLVYRQTTLGGSNSKSVLEEVKTDVTFKDVIGHDEVIEEIKTLAQLMECKDTKFKARLPKGLLLIGPPGTGKTLIAKAIANETNRKFYYINSSSFIEMFAGLGAKKMRKAFEIAKKNTPCIIFLDELDSIGGNRGDSGDNVSNEYKQTLNELLQQLDGFNSDSDIFIMAATNMYESLDKALVRPGRFDRKISINPPKTWKIRMELFKHYTDGLDLGEIDLESLSRQTAGYTGADIAKVVNEAKLVGIMRHKEVLDMSCFNEALSNEILKGTRTKSSNSKDMELVAYHESGHALSMLLHGTEIGSIQITPNTSDVGGMVSQNDMDTQFVSKQHVIDKIMCLYSGRVAEELIYGEDNITVGASNDIEVATQLLIQYINKFGFDGSLVNSDVLIKNGYRDREVTSTRLTELSNDYYYKAKLELKENIGLLEKIATEVLDKEIMSGSELKEIYKNAIEKRGIKKVELG